MTPMGQTKSEFVAAEIRAELGRQSKSNAWLASKLDVSEMWVSRRLRDVTDITVADLERIAAALDVPVTNFLPTSARAV